MKINIDELLYSSFNCENYIAERLEKIRYADNLEVEGMITETIHKIRRLGSPEFELKFQFELAVKFPSHQNLYKKVIAKIDDNGNDKQQSTFDELRLVLKDKFPELFVNAITHQPYYRKNGQNYLLNPEILNTVLREKNVMISSAAIKDFLNSPEHTLHLNTVEQWLKSICQWTPQSPDMIEKFLDVFTLKQNADGIDDRKFLKTQILKYFVRSLAHAVGTIDNFNNRINNKQALILLSEPSSGKTSFIVDYLLWVFKELDLVGYSFDFQVKNANVRKELTLQVFNMVEEFNGFCNQKSNISHLAIKMFKEITGRYTISFRDAGKSRVGLRRMNFMMSTNKRSFIYDDSMVTRFIVMDLENNNKNKVKFESWNKKDDTNMFWAQIYYYLKQALAGTYDMQMTYDEQLVMEAINSRYIGSKSHREIFFDFVKDGRSADKKNVQYLSASQICSYLKTNARIPEAISAMYTEVSVGMFLRAANFIQNRSKDRAWTVTLH